MKSTKFIKEVYENFPEASMCLRCVKWDNENFIFEFIDDDEGGEKYTVTEQKALDGLRIFRRMVKEGKLPGLSLPAGWPSDTGLMDAWSFDAINQCAIFGDVIYG